MRKEAVEALGGKDRAGSEGRTVPALILAVKDKNRLVRFGAEDALGKIGPAGKGAAPCPHPCREG